MYVCMYVYIYIYIYIYTCLHVVYWFALLSRVAALVGPRWQPGLGLLLPVDPLTWLMPLSSSSRV